MALLVPEVAGEYEFEVVPSGALIPMVPGSPVTPAMEVVGPTVPMLKPDVPPMVELPGPVAPTPTVVSVAPDVVVLLVVEVVGFDGGVTSKAVYCAIAVRVTSRQADKATLAKTNRLMMDLLDRDVGAHESWRKTSVITATPARRAAASLARCSLVPQSTAG